MGFFVPDDQPVIWRGPMLHKALEQFLVDAYWGEPDYLLIDMPPGTGDVALSLGQYLPRTEILVVTTPQHAAQRVAQRSAFAARTLKLSVRGVIENMSWFTGDDGRRYEVFGSGGGEALSEELGVPLLAKLPLLPAVRQAGDTGVPVGSRARRGGRSGLSRTGRQARLVGPARIYRSDSGPRISGLQSPPYGGNKSEETDRTLVAGRCYCRCQSSTPRGNLPGSQPSSETAVAIANRSVIPATYVTALRSAASLPAGMPDSHGGIVFGRSAKYSTRARNTATTAAP